MSLFWTRDDAALTSRQLHERFGTVMTVTEADRRNRAENSRMWKVVVFLASIPIAVWIAIKLLQFSGGRLITSSSPATLFKKLFLEFWMLLENWTGDTHPYSPDVAVLKAFSILERIPDWLKESFLVSGLVSLPKIDSCNEFGIPNLVNSRRST